MRYEKLKMRKVEMVRNVRSERGDRILTWMLERNIEVSDAVFAMCSVAHVALLILQMPLLRNHEACLGGQRGSLEMRNCLLGCREVCMGKALNIKIPQKRNSKT